MATTKPHMELIRVTASTDVTRFLCRAIRSPGARERDRLRDYLNNTVEGKPQGKPPNGKYALSKSKIAIADNKT